MAINRIRLVELLVESGYLAAIGNSYPFSTKDLEHSTFYKEASEVYKSLNGRQVEAPIHSIEPGIVINDRIFLEIDDHTHFNRYRTITLRSQVYDGLKGIDLEKYRRYCRMYEKECLKSGLQEGFWSYELSVHHFGAASAPGDFFGNGSPGWKMKAYRDFLIDLFVVVNHFHLIRIPCYDTLLVNNKLIRIGKLYEKGGSLFPMIRFLEKRLSEI